MPMPGGWTLSMAWMRMPGQTWLGAAATFLGMWVVMMVAMMLPPLVPALSRYRRAVGGPGDVGLGARTALAGTGYFFVWSLVGAGAFLVGMPLVAAELRSAVLARSAPIATGIALLLAGALQFTAWKRRHLARCRACDLPGSADAWQACRFGLRLGAHCALCCAGFMTVLVVAGMMHLWLVAAVAVVIAVERLVPWPERIARTIGGVLLAVGALTLLQALGSI